jgi:hypothetical protein
MAMYMRPKPFPEAHASVRVSRIGSVTLAVCIAALLYFGVRPNQLLHLTRTSGATIAPPAAGTAVIPRR